MILSLPASTSVLIAGGGPVGLALAIELGRNSIPCVLVDPIVPRTTADLLAMTHIESPRAKLTNIRSMEHARRWGIAGTLRRTAPLPPDYPAVIRFMTRLNGYSLATIENAFGFRPDEGDDFAERPLQCPQFVVEAVLRDYASTLPSVSLAYGNRLESFEQDDRSVTARVVDGSGAKQSIAATYLAGCDGSRSVVRDVLGITMDGERSLGHSVTVIFREPGLMKRAQVDPAYHYWLINSETPGLLGPLDGGDVWWSLGSNLAADARGIRELDPVAILRGQTGLDITPTIMDVTPWAPHSLLAQRFSEGRAFLAGDAAHLHPPYGGHGMNLGIGDGVDLGWKLSAVLAGWATPALLASYDIERRQLARRVIDTAVGNFKAVSNAFVRPNLEADSDEGRALRASVGESLAREKLTEFRSVGIVAGYHYEDSPAIVSDGTPALPDSITEYVPTSRPGYRAPHHWLGANDSLFDHFGPGFTLLTQLVRAGEADAFAAHATANGMPVTALALGDAVIAERYPRAFTLIRPDQHVAWRGEDLAAASDALRSVTGGAPVLR